MRRPVRANARCPRAGSPDALRGAVGGVRRWPSVSRGSSPGAGAAGGRGGCAADCTGGPPTAGPSGRTRAARGGRTHGARWRKWPAPTTAGEPRPRAPTARCPPACRASGNAVAGRLSGAPCARLETARSAASSGPGSARSTSARSAATDPSPRGPARPSGVCITRLRTSDTAQPGSPPETRCFHCRPGRPRSAPNSTSRLAAWRLPSPTACPAPTCPPPTSSGSSCVGIGPPFRLILYWIRRPTVLRRGFYRIRRSCGGPKQPIDSCKRPTAGFKLRCCFCC